MLRDLASYLAYLERIRERTLALVDQIPPEHFDWTPRPGEYTIGDLVRHFASVEQMDVSVALGAGWHYAGHAAADWGATLDEARTNLARVHAESLSRLRAADDTLLLTKRLDLEGHSVSTWRILMALVEHEIHHRSQLAMYLTLLNIAPPQLFGTPVESLPRD